MSTGTGAAGASSLAGAGGDNGLGSAASLPNGTVWTVGDAVTGTVQAPLVMRTLTG